jgi:hypothetical protein
VKYLRLILGDEQTLDDATGQSPAAGTRHPTPTARGVALRRHAPLITDGPFAETRELLGGYQ